MYPFSHTQLLTYHACIAGILNKHPPSLCPPPPPRQCGSSLPRLHGLDVADLDSWWQAQHAKLAEELGEFVMDVLMPGEGRRVGGGACPACKAGRGAGGVSDGRADAR